MIDTDKYENMRRLFLDFIGTADEDTEDAWKNKLTMLDELLAEVKRLREAFITAVRHVGEHDLSRDDLFSKLDEDLFSLWLFRSE